MSDNVIVRNNTVRGLTLGEKIPMLAPGKNTLPRATLDEIEAGAHGAGVKRMPKEWQDQGLIHVPANAAESAAVAKLPDEAPPSLGDKPLELAISLVEIEESEATLKRWKGADRRAEFKSAVDKRLGELKGFKLPGQK